MTTIEIAHIREQGQDMILVPVDNSFGYKSPQEKTAAVSELERRATSAGLRGRVAVLWEFRFHWTPPVASVP